MKKAIITTLQYYNIKDYKIINKNGLYYIYLLDLSNIVVDELYSISNKIIIKNYV